MCNHSSDGVVGGVAHDAQRQLHLTAGCRSDGYASRAIIHVFQLNSSPGAITAPAQPRNAVNSVRLTADRPRPTIPGALQLHNAGGGVGHAISAGPDGATSTVALD